MPEQLELTHAEPDPRTEADALANVFTAGDLVRVANVLRQSIDPELVRLSRRLKEIISLRPYDDQMILLPIAGPVLDALVNGLAAETAHVAPSRAGVALLYYRGWRLGCRPPIEESP
jgi:hypothetical protein